MAEAARAICDRNTGVGADGWILLSAAAEADAAIELLNSDGSRERNLGQRHALRGGAIDPRPAARRTRKSRFPPGPASSD